MYRLVIEVYGYAMGSVLVAYGKHTVKFLFCTVGLMFCMGGLRFRSRVYGQCTDDTPINCSATCYYYNI